MKNWKIWLTISIIFALLISWMVYDSAQAKKKQAAKNTLDAAKAASASSAVKAPVSQSASANPIQSDAATPQTSVAAVENNPAAQAEVVSARFGS